MVKGKSIRQNTGNLVEAGGIVVNPDTSLVSFSPAQMEAGENFFWADHYRVESSGGFLRILFGQAGYDLTDKNLTLAVQIIFPIRYAVLAMYKSVCVEPSSSGVGVFLDSLKSHVAEMERDFQNISDGSEYKQFSVPRQIANFRRFPANFSSCSIANGEAMIEFFEASPHLITNSLNRGGPRKGERVKNVVSIICGPKVLLTLLEECINILKPYYREA